MICVLLPVDVCFVLLTLVLVVVMSVAEQFHTCPVPAFGIVMVQVPVLLVPTPTRKAPVPLFDRMDAAEPPHPAAAIVGALVFRITPVP